MESLFNSYNSDDENDTRKQENSGCHETRTESAKEVDVNYESVTMDMSEDSSSDQASNQPPPRIDDTARKKYGNGKQSNSSSDHSSSESDSDSSQDSSRAKRSVADKRKDRKRSNTKERSPESPHTRNSRDKSRDRSSSKHNDRSSRDRKSVDRRSRDKRSSSRRSRDRSPSERRRRDRSRSRSRSRDAKISRKDRGDSDRKDRKSGRDDRDRRDRDRRDRDRDRRDRNRKHRSRSPSDKDRYRSKYRKSHRSRSRSRSRRSKSRSHSRRRSRSRSTSGSPSYSSRHYRRSSRDDGRSRERSHRSALSYKSEKTKNKMQVLEKLGIELKVPPEIPIILPNHPNSANMQGLVNPQTLLQKTLQEQVEKVKSATGIELPSYYNPAAVNPSKYAEQIQKRRLLWGNKDKQLNNASALNTLAPTAGVAQPSQPTAIPTTTNTTINAATGTIWTGAKFGDQDGKMTAKFQRLMGIKQPSTEQQQPSSSDATVADKPDIIKKQEEMFSSMESQYEVARLATHTHRGL